VVNDTFGHQIGDQVLQEVAEVFTSSIRPSDRVFRWGGEEFLVALPETKSSEAIIILNRLADNIRNAKIDCVGTLTISVGVSEFVNNDDFDSIVKRVDDALYNAKDNGRDKVVMG
jgi:diguanylate cyclase (GGDEF)-like protein